jgi:hypothetical protein
MAVRPRAGCTHGYFNNPTKPANGSRAHRARFATRSPGQIRIAPRFDLRCQAATIAGETGGASLYPCCRHQAWKSLSCVP